MSMTHGNPAMASEISAKIMVFVEGNLLVFAVITGITLLLSFKFLLQSRFRKLPPLPKTGMIEMMSILSGDEGAPEYYYSTMKKEGLVYRLPLPELSHWVVVCDPALARKILLEEDEKPALYSRFDGLTNHVPTVFSAPTHSHSWPSARKGMAPSFSMANICLSLPKMYEKIDELKSVLARHESEKTTIDLPELMTQLALDFICAGKSSNTK
jgi:cytochrome P450